MNLNEFNNICLSLGWDKDVGYCYGDEYRLSTIYYNLNDRVDDYLVITSVNVDYITKPTEPIEEFTIYLNNIVDGKIVLVDERKYDLLYKAFGWEIPKYIHCPHITDETHKKLSKRSGHSSYQDLLEQGFRFHHLLS